MSICCCFFFLLLFPSAFPFGCREEEQKETRQQEQLTLTQNLFLFVSSAANNKSGAR
jgi:hypothetical protein